MLIGADRQQTPVALPALGPHPTRLGVLGDHRIATLLAYRLLGVGARLHRGHRRPGPLATAADRRRVPRDGRREPGGLAALSATEPQLLVTDLPHGAVADRWATDRCARCCTWRPRCRPTRRTGPGCTGWCWPGAATAARWPTCWAAPTPAELDQLGPGQLGVLDRGRALVVTPILAEVELALLTD